MDHDNYSCEDQYCDTRRPYKAERIPDMFADGNVRKSKTNVDSCYGWADRSCQSSGKEEGCGYNLRCDTEWLYYADDDREKCVVEGVSTEDHHERYGEDCHEPVHMRSDR